MGPPVYWFPTLCWPEINRLSDISSAKMGLSRISRELQFEVCICGEPSVSPQSARAGEHIERKRRFGGLLQSPWLFIACILARKGEESLFFLLSVAVVVISSIKVLRGFLLGTTWDYWSTLWWWLLFVWGDFVLFRASLTLSASQGGVLSRCSPHFPKASTERLCGCFTVI